MSFFLGCPLNQVKIKNSSLFGGVYGHFEAIMGSWMCGMVSLDVDEIGAG